MVVACLLDGVDARVGGSGVNQKLQQIRVSTVICSANRLRNNDKRLR